MVSGTLIFTCLYRAHYPVPCPIVGSGSARGGAHNMHIYFCTRCVAAVGGDTLSCHLPVYLPWVVKSNLSLARLSDRGPLGGGAHNIYTHICCFVSLLLFMVMQNRLAVCIPWVVEATCPLPAFRVGVRSGGQSPYTHILFVAAILTCRLVAAACVRICFFTCLYQT
jgi:hypothetical protein